MTEQQWPDLPAPESALDQVPIIQTSRTRHDGTTVVTAVSDLDGSDAGRSMGGATQAAGFTMGLVDGVRDDEDGREVEHNVLLVGVVLPAHGVPAWRWPIKQFAFPLARPVLEWLRDSAIEKLQELDQDEQGEPHA